jgi:HemY protein
VGEWSELIRLMPELRKDKVLPAQELAELEKRAWGENLSLAAYRDVDGDTGPAGLPALEKAWQQLTSGTAPGACVDSGLCRAASSSWRRCAGRRGSAQCHEARLQPHWRDSMVWSAAAIRVKQLQAAEGWLKNHPDDPGLLLTLGRLCLQSSLWGKARDYLEASLQATTQSRSLCRAGSFVGAAG